MASTFALSPSRRPPLSRRDQSRLLIAALVIAVLIADAVVVVPAAANIDITSLYITTM